MVVWCQRVLLAEANDSSDGDGDADAKEATPFGGSDGSDDDHLLEQSALVHNAEHEEIHKGQHTSAPLTLTHHTHHPLIPLTLPSLPRTVPRLSPLSLCPVLSVVAKTKRLLPLEYLSQPLSSSSTAPIPLTQLPKGGKAFEEREFSSGVLVLPPLAKKQHEQTCTVESFVILSAAPKSLQVTIGPQGTAFRLSKGDQFVVPLGNVYSLYNLSETKAVEAYFHLITPKEEVEREVREQMRKEETNSQPHNGRPGKSRAKGGRAEGDGPIVH